MPARGEKNTLGEFDIIARYFAPLATDPSASKLRDDAAVLRVPDGLELVATTDAIVEGVHFLPGDPPETIGHKALAVNLSDLAAKGARPLAYLLSLWLPGKPQEDWLQSFAKGLRALQEEADIALIGGDTSSTPGPLSISITALGAVPQGHAVLRMGARAGDMLYASGTIGDAHLGLRLSERPRLAAEWGLSEEEKDFLVDRYRRPQARFPLALPLRNCAEAAIDISDGLVGDVEKLARCSNLDACIELKSVPFSPAANKAAAGRPELLHELISAGDDYEIVAAVAPDRAKAFEAEAVASGVALTAIGRLDKGEGGVRVLSPGGNPIGLDRKGFEHFEEDQAG